mmetsp:Transcript_14279/g.35847  ORF Transcript_14279/g.35847 Transcript_14279/m.35847 type:complete len:91 (-) Transcript_14279:1771-2043(-)
MWKSSDEDSDATSSNEADIVVEMVLKSLRGSGEVMTSFDASVLVSIFFTIVQGLPLIGLSSDNDFSQNPSMEKLSLSMFNSSFSKIKVSC